VLNPNAGRGGALRAGPRVARALEARGLACEVILEASAEAARARVRALGSETAVVAVGGDGTASGLLPAVVCTGRPFGVVPVGRGNDFVSTLGWRGGGLKEVALRLTGTPRALDVLRVHVAGTERYCLNGLGMGFDAQVTAHAARAPNVLGGFGGYAFGVLQAVRELRACGLQVTVDGAAVFDGESFLAAVMNGTRYGGGFHISPRSDVTDGLLDVLVGRPVNTAHLLPLAARVVLGRHLGHPKVTHVRGRAVTLCWSEPMHLHSDGDLLSPATEVRVELVPRGVLMLGA